MGFCGVPVSGTLLGKGWDALEAAAPFPPHRGEPHQGLGQPPLLPLRGIVSFKLEARQNWCLTGIATPLVRVPACFLWVKTDISRSVLLNQLLNSGIIFSLS